MEDSKIEFRISKNILFRLEDDQTSIYIDGIFFRQCKLLLLNISIDNTPKLNELPSIDEIANFLNNGQEANYINSNKFQIDPITEFWAHCSNIQAWVENKYDTRIMHRNLAFPMLKKLIESGDKLAIKAFKEEIAKRFQNGNNVVRNYLINEGYMSYLSEEELWCVLPTELDIIRKIKEFTKFSLNVIHPKNHLTPNQIMVELEDQHISSLTFTYCSAKMKKWIQILSELSILTSLKYLSFENSNLEFLPDDIGKLNSLETLDLSGNNLYKLPDSLLKLKLLKKLYLNKNNFSRVPDIIFQLNNLVKLNLKNNPLVDEKSSILQCLPNLKFIYI